MEKGVKWLAVAVVALAVAVAALTGAVLYSGMGGGDSLAPPTPLNLAAACGSGGTSEYDVLRIQQESMRPTLEQNDVVLVERNSTQFQGGNLIAFRPTSDVPELVQPFAKRIIAIAGDSVAIRDGDVLVNGTALTEPYALGPTSANGDQDSWQVPAGSVFVLGDNRNNSTDSRSATIGPVAVDTIIRRVIYRCAPAPRAGPL
jgi:signal peptidase I